MESRAQGKWHTQLCPAWVVTASLCSSNLFRENGLEPAAGGIRCGPHPALQSSLMLGWIHDAPTGTFAKEQEKNAG